MGYKKPQFLVISWNKNPSFTLGLNNFFIYVNSGLHYKVCSVTSIRNTCQKKVNMERKKKFYFMSVKALLDIWGHTGFQ